MSSSPRLRCVIELYAVKGSGWGEGAAPDEKTTLESNPDDLSVNRRRMSGSGIKRLDCTRVGQLSLCM